MHEPEIFLHTCVFFCALLLKRSFGGKDMVRSFRTSKTDGSEESAVSDDFIASVRKKPYPFYGIWLQSVQRNRMFRFGLFSAALPSTSRTLYA